MNNEPTPGGQLEPIVSLRPCPCGKTPAYLEIIAEGSPQPKWARAAGNCCGAWEVEFRNGYADIGSNECTQRAEKAWNDAPRANT